MGAFSSSCSTSGDRGPTSAALRQFIDGLLQHLAHDQIPATVANKGPIIENNGRTLEDEGRTLEDEGRTLEDEGRT